MLLLNVIPTVWTVGYAIPYHFGMLCEKYGVGLGINSMQGQEAKHVCSQQYARHSSVSKRWHNVLKHRYISSTLPTTKSSSYIPKPISCSGFCYCGFKKDEKASKCVYCCSSIYKAVEVTVLEGKISEEISDLLYKV